MQGLLISAIIGDLVQHWDLKNQLLV